MEQPSQRNKFFKNHLNDCLAKLTDQITETILSYLYEDTNNPFKELMPVLRGLPDLSAKRLFVLMKYTEERNSTIYLANVMKRLDLSNITAKLLEYNKSAEFIPYVTDLSLQVSPADVVRGGDSMCFKLDTQPKGYFLIIINELDLEAEAKQVTSVFKQLGFEVSPIYKRLKCKEIDQLFENVATDPKFKNYGALVTMMIGHGKNGLFLGVDPNNDGVLIPDLVDKFAGNNKDRNFNNTMSKPKIHIFNCCRERNVEKMTKEQNKETIDSSRIEKTLLQNYFKPNWVNENINTTVIYACSEGLKSWYMDNDKFSFFGRALTHTLAQYACEQEFHQLMRTLNKRLLSDGVADHYPEVINYRARWGIYLNPGFPAPATV